MSSFILSLTSKDLESQLDFDVREITIIHSIYGESGSERYNIHFKNGVNIELYQNPHKKHLYMNRTQLIIKWKLALERQ